MEKREKEEEEETDDGHKLRFKRTLIVEVS